MLTKRQKQVFEFIKNFYKKNEVSPTYEEISNHLKVSSTSTINDHLSNLEKEGLILIKKNQPRGIEITELQSTIEIPLVGEITAGKPIEAIEVPEETITITKDKIGKFGNYYALRVIGNSMVNEGIFDGDIVVIKKQPTAENGQTVVAIIDDNEATLKKIYREKDKFRLQPENPSLFPIYRQEVEVRGIVVKIIRNVEKPIENKNLQKPEKYIRKIDNSWDYNGEKTKNYTHGIHTYPAMFIPQIARRLLLTYSNKGDTVGDIFCGSGTTLVESRLTGRDAYGIDLNPLATFLAKVKTTEMEPNKLTREYIKLFNRIKEIKNSDVKKPEFFNLEFWFKKEVITQLAKTKKAINEIKDKDIRDFFLVSFSETVRIASNTKGGEFKLVRIKNLEQHNPSVLDIFKKKTEQAIKGMTEFYQYIDKKTWSKPILGDSSQNNGLKANSIDFILTSPPYGDSQTTVAYGQFSRLSGQWIDVFNKPNEATKTDSELLGGKTLKELKHKLQSEHLNKVINEIKNKDQKRAKEVLSFYLDLNKCLRQAYRLLKKNKYFAIVIGNRMVKQIRIPTDFIVAELGENIGFSYENIFVRNIPGKRMPSKNSPKNKTGAMEETMSKESIVILKKT